MIKIRAENDSMMLHQYTYYNTKLIPDDNKKNCMKSQNNARL